MKKNTMYSGTEKYKIEEWGKNKAEGLTELK